MKIDLAALTMGLSAAAPGEGAKVPAIGSQVGKRTADSPFAVLLASAVPGRWSEGSSGGAAAPTGAEPALVTLGLGAAKARRAATGQAGQGARRGELQQPALPATPPSKADPGAEAEEAILLAGLGEAPPTPAHQDQAQGATGAALAQPEQPVVEVQEAVESQPLPAQAPSLPSGGEGAALAAQAALAARLQVASPSPAPRPTSPAPSAAAGAATAQGLVAKLATSGASPLARNGVPVAQGAPAGSADPAGAADAAATLRVSMTGPQVKPSTASEPQPRFAGPVQPKAAPGPQDSSTAPALNAAASVVSSGVAATQAAAAARLGTVRAQARAQDGNVTATAAQTRSQDHAGGRSSARLAEAPAQPTLRPAAPASPEGAPLRTERASGAARAATAASPAPAPAAELGQAASPQAEPPLEQARADARASRREEAGRRSTEPVAIPRLAATADRPSAPAQPTAAAPEAASRPAPTSFVARDLSTSARLTQASRAGQPLPEAAEPQRARASHPAGEQLPQHAAALQAQPPAPEPAAPKAAAPVHRPAPVVQEPLQPGVTGTILPGGAHLRLESETMGDLALHLRIRDGVAHLRVEGEQASALAGHGHELQRALAAEGLQLGKLELDRPRPQAPQPAEASRGPADQSLTQGQRERPEQGESGGAAGHTPSTTPSAQGRRPQGRTTAHHVEA